MALLEKVDVDWLNRQPVYLQFAHGHGGHHKTRREDFVAMLCVTGQIALVDGVLKHAGRVPDTISLDEAQQSARVCAINLITQLNAACNGDLERVVRCVKLGGFVACDSSFVDHPKVINGASDLMAAVFGDKVPHARFAVGASSLPLGASVEVDAVFEIR